MPKSAYRVTLGEHQLANCTTPCKYRTGSSAQGGPMKGKVGLVIGLSVGYVLGTRAGRERYEQIKTQWLKLWNTAPVQRQVVKA